MSLALFDTTAVFKCHRDFNFSKRERRDVTQIFIKFLVMELIVEFQSLTKEIIQIFKNKTIYFSRKQMQNASCKIDHNQRHRNQHLKQLNPHKTQLLNQSRSYTKMYTGCSRD